VRTSLKLLAGAVAACAACGDGGGPAVVEIEAQPVTREAVRSGSLSSVESGGRAIRVRQIIRVPDACRTLSADLLRTGNDLTLRVHAAPAGQACPPSEEYLAYQAQIRRVPAGRYSLRVVHASGAHREGARVVLEHPVVVLERSVDVR
jgi:hypothetical protein